MSNEIFAKVLLGVFKGFYKNKETGIWFVLFWFVLFWFVLVWFVL